MTGKEMMDREAKLLADLIAERNSLRDQVKTLQDQLAQPEQEPDYWLGYGLQAHTEKPFEGATPVWTKPQPKEQEQEPVVWRSKVDGVWFTSEKRDFLHRELVKAKVDVEIEPLYTTPPKRQWVGLTDEEIEKISNSVPVDEMNCHTDTWHIKFARAIEAKIKDRNGAK